MGKLSEVFAKIKDKVKSMSVGQKIAFVLIFSIILGFIIFYTSYSRANKYGVLFSNLSAEDGNLIKQALEDKNVEMKIEGNTIYVPKEQVDSLRLELAGSLTGGSTGYELLDESSSFGMTDEQFNLQKLRATQGELERTIKSFSQIKNARVHITPGQESVFAKEATPAKAAVYLELKPGTKLTNDNVKSIIALVSGSVGNLPKENIEVIDDKLNLLSKGLVDDEDSSQLIGSLDKQQETKKAFDKNLEEAAMEMLSLAFGKNNVNVTVNSKLDFDAKEKTVISYDPNKVEEALK
jgi:flagellar M-ring protein FliF